MMRAAPTDFPDFVLIRMKVAAVVPTAIKAVAVGTTAATY
jgi:hypothetical protein